MDLVAFHYDRSFVLDALRQGEIDYLEHVSEAAEADLFRHLLRRQVVQRLAETYPTPRKKEEVPVWVYLASELSLKLHGAQAYHALPRILRYGGLIEALGPELGGRKSLHPDTGDVTLACPGFNDKNDYVDEHNHPVKAEGNSSGTTVDFAGQISPNRLLYAG
jgi:hypothetical protein